MLWWTLRQLRSENSRSRERAANTLVTARAVDPLIAALKDKSWNVRHTAVVALGEIGDAQAIEPLTALIHEIIETKAGDYILDLIISAFKNINDPRAIKPLLELLELSQASYLDKRRAEIGMALGHVTVTWVSGADKTKGSAAAIFMAAVKENPGYLNLSSFPIDLVCDLKDVDVLIEALDVITFHVDRDKCVKALGVVGDQRAIEPIVAQLKNGRVSKQDAAEALARISVTQAVESLLRAVKSGGTADLLWALQKIDPNALKGAPETTAAAVASLLAELERLRDSEYASQERRAVIDQLGELGDARAVKPLLTVLLNASGIADEHEKGAAMSALAKIGDPRAVEPLLELLKDWQTEFYAALALGILGDSRAVEPLILKLREAGRPDSKTNFATALCRIKDHRAIRPLVEYCKKGIAELNSWKGTANTIIAFIRQALGSDMERIPKGDLEAIASLNQITERLVYGTDYGYETSDERRVDASDLSKLARDELASRSESASPSEETP